MERRCDRCKATLALGRPRVRVGGKQLWCQTCAKRHGASGQYEPGSDIAKAASAEDDYNARQAPWAGLGSTNWHQFDTNHSYRSGHVDGAQGEQQEHDRLRAKIDMQMPLDDREQDYLVGHTHGQERAREYAEGNHRMKQVWEDHGQDYKSDDPPSLPRPRTAHLDPADLIGLQNSREFVRADMNGSLPRDNRDRPHDAITHLKRDHDYKGTEELHGLSSEEIEAHHQRAHAFEESNRGGAMEKYMPPMHDHTRRNFDPHRDGLMYSLNALNSTQRILEGIDPLEPAEDVQTGAKRDKIPFRDPDKRNATNRLLEAKLNTKMTLTATLTGQRIIVVAHDSGDGETIYHCPFCGSGQVIARSDRTIECEFCHTSFTVQVQPEFSAFPQTMDGQPVQVPGMPGQIDSPVGQDPAAMGADPGINGAPNADADGDGTPNAMDADFDPANPASANNQPPWLKSGLRTSAGKVLPVSDYVRHLALKHAEETERPTVLRAVRASRST